MSRDEQLNTLKDIRSMMERSSKFISLSGLTGIFIGIYALAAAAIGMVYLDRHYLDLDNAYNDSYKYTPASAKDLNLFFIGLAIAVLLASIVTAIFTTRRKAKKAGLNTWDTIAKRMILNLLIPLFTGGIFSLMLVFKGSIGYVAPSMLIFYGLALVNASKYTFNDIRFLGLCEIALGLLAMMYIGYGLIFWAIGFGVLHIVYGVVMYYKYDR